MHKEPLLKINKNDGAASWESAYSDVQANGALETSEVEPALPLKGVEIGCHRTDVWHNVKRIHSEGSGEYFLKRPLDVVLSLVGIVICFPLWGLIALCIWVEDGGPVLYCSPRVGRRGRVFKAYKFRTMVADSDRRFGPLQAEKNDHRITRAGRLLRATAMDEIPQLWNVFKGDMSMVGPRALVPVEIEVKHTSINGSGAAVPLQKIPGYWRRHSVKPGLSGIAQIYAPRDVTRRQKFRYDIVYIERQSLWLDVTLISLSFWITLRGKWESRGKKF